MKIPDKAKKVFTGVIFDTYQWEQEMFDGSQATFEMLKRPDTLQVICTQEDKIIMGRESQPNKKDFYSLFGGRLEKDEDHLSGAKRELKEETGLESDDWEEIKVYEPYTKMEWEIHVYVARNCKKVAEQNLDSGEKIELIEVNFDEFIDLVLNEKFYGKEIVEGILRMKLDNTLDDFKQKLFKK